MTGMPLPCEFQGKGVLDLDISGFSSSSDLLFPTVLRWNGFDSTTKEGGWYLGAEPTSVLETTRSPSPPTSSSTSHGGGGGGGVGGGSGGGSTAMTSVAVGIAGSQSQKWPQQDTGIDSSAGVGESRREDWGSELQPIPTALDLGGGPEKCGMGMEDWVSLLSESATSPGQEQSIYRLIMGDVEDASSMGINRLLQGDGGAASSDFEFNAGFGVVDQGLGPPEPAPGNLAPFPCFTGAGTTSGSSNNISPHNVPNFAANSKIPNPVFSPLLNNLLPLSSECPVEKPQVFNSQLLLNQPQNPTIFMNQQEQQHLLVSQAPPPPPKRRNSGSPSINAPYSLLPKQPFLDSGQELFLRRQQQLQHGQHHHQQQIQGFPHQLPLLPTQPRPRVGPTGGDHQHHLQQVVSDQLYKAAEMLDSGNLVLAQGILARLNHQLSPVGKPFLRAAFYYKEALLQLLHHLTHHHHNNSPTTTASSFPSPHQSPINLIYRIAAHKSFSEISPILQFANFTIVQALIEALDGSDRLHIVDFDIGYGGQWAALMQELALRNSGNSSPSPSLKITAFVSVATHNELEFSLIRENLTHFAAELNIPFDLEISSLESLNSVTSWSMPLNVSENEAIAVNIPVGSSGNHSLPLPLVLRFVKQLCPKIVVSLDRGHDRSDLTFPQHVVCALQSHGTLLDSLDAVNQDSLQKIERFLIHPEIEKAVLGRPRGRDKSPPWRALFPTCGFSPLTFSNFNESQAECVVKRCSVRGFHVEKRHSSLVLCWQGKELISASAWRC